MYVQFVRATFYGVRTELPTMQLPLETCVSKSMMFSISVNLRNLLALV